MGDALTVADVLERAADLIEPEGAWTQGLSARTISGGFIAADHAAATCWCAIGAIVRVAAEERVIEQSADCLRDTLSCSIPEYNDAPERTQAEVVAKLREVAALARKEGN